jgi:cytochrome c556
LQVQYEQDLERAPAEQRHAIHDERLQQLMRGLDRLSNERLPKSLDVESERQFRANQVAAAALALSESASLIREGGSHGDLAPAQRAQFEAYADALGSEALDLSRDAPSLSLDAMHARLAAIEEICESCHARFRPEGSR